MTICELIKHEHDEIDDLLVQLAALARDDRRMMTQSRDEAERLAARLVALVRIHARAEERVMYEVLKTSTPPLKAFALAGPHEHENLDITLDKLLVQRPGDEFEVLVRVAHDLFEMHARDEEEADVLPLIAEAFDDDDQRILARDMLVEEARIKPQILRLVGMPARAA